MGPNPLANVPQVIDSRWRMKALPGQQTLTAQQALDLALQYHNTGRLGEAENIYTQVLKVEPNHPIALHLLGVIAHQVGKNDVAVDLIGKSISIKPDYVEAHNNLGLTLFALGKLDDASASYRRALALNPDYGEVLSNLGAALFEAGKFDEAEAHIRKALALKPDFAEAHSNLGMVVNALNRLDEAIACYHRALSFKPDYAEAYYNLCVGFISQGNFGDAFQSARRAVAINPDIELYWQGFAASVEKISFASADEDLRRELSTLLERPATVRPGSIVRPIISALRHHPNFSQVLELITSCRSVTAIPFNLAAEQLSEIPLFIQILKLSPISDVEIERMLVAMRQSQLQAAIEGKWKESGLPFAVSLALQCFTNEYVYQETEEESAAVKVLEKRVKSLIQKKAAVAAFLIATLATYRPLYSLSLVQNFCVDDWDEIEIKELLDRHISEPIEEAILRPQIPRLTSIKNEVSRSVRAQYENRPYPRWVRTHLKDKGRSIKSILQKAPLGLDLGGYEPPNSPEVLIAGCGTGQQSLDTAAMFSNAQVLAVDLSLSSLTYAQRMTNVLGITNIHYAQADIMELAGLGKQFDLIESLGVLHHLDDPQAGWKVLVDLLRPGGLMKIGLYSEMARQSVVAARKMITEKGYSATADDIRQFRQELMMTENNGDKKVAKITEFADFYSLSECQDLLFHVQEHRFNLLEIDNILNSLNLKFLGFEMRDHVPLTAFRSLHKEKQAQTSLRLWHDFEVQNPDTFVSMYQFWCQKI